MGRSPTTILLRENSLGAVDFYSISCAILGGPPKLPDKPRYRIAQFPVQFPTDHPSVPNYGFSAVEQPHAPVMSPDGRQRALLHGHQHHNRLLNPTWPLCLEGGVSLRLLRTSHLGFLGHAVVDVAGVLVVTILGL